MQAVKHLQTLRFRGTYADLLLDPLLGPAAQFFLEELYGTRDYSERDAQFARIAGTVATVFPEAVVRTAVRLAGLHAMTEELDLAMAVAWSVRSESGDARRYVLAWRDVAALELRRKQLLEVLALGRDLGELTRAPGLRLMLRVMRGPASASGLGALQSFLEVGFDTFGAMARRPGAVTAFMSTIETREAQWLADLFDCPLVACETKLAAILGEAR